MHTDRHCSSVHYLANKIYQLFDRLFIHPCQIFLHMLATRALYDSNLLAANYYWLACSLFASAVTDESAGLTQVLTCRYSPVSKISGQLLPTQSQTPRMVSARPTHPLRQETFPPQKGFLQCASGKALVQAPRTLGRPHLEAWEAPILLAKLRVGLPYRGIPDPSAA